MVERVRSLLSALVGVISAEALPPAKDLTSFGAVAPKGSPFLVSGLKRPLLLCVCMCVCVFRFYCSLFSPSVRHFA